jgi:hypothetical protein
MRRLFVSALVVYVCIASRVHSQQTVDHTPTATPTTEAIPDSTANNQDEPTVPDSKDVKSKASDGDRPGKELSPELIELRERVKRCLAHYFYNPETISRRSPWAVMHCVVGFGVDTPLLVGDKEYNAISWLCGNLPCRGMRLISTYNRRLHLPIAPGMQGHNGQFLSILAQSRVKIDYPLWVGNSKLTVADLVKHEQLNCRSGTELTFLLIGLSHYLDTEATWENRRGEEWSIPRLIREELTQPIVDGCCGGTHRLMGYSYAVRKRKKSGKPVNGQWWRAKNLVEDYQNYAFKLQNADGSLSTNWFRGRGKRGDAERKLNTTGHVLEWLVFSLPKEDLTDPRVVKAVSFLTGLLWENRHHSLDIGPQGHAVHALALYDEYVFGGGPGKRASELASYKTENRSPRDEGSELTHVPDTAWSNSSETADASTSPGDRAWRR